MDKELNNLYEIRKELDDIYIQERRKEKPDQYFISEIISAMDNILVAIEHKKESLVAMVS